MRNAIKSLFGAFGYDLIAKRRIRAPFQTTVHAPGHDYQFWIANDVGALWYGAADHRQNGEMLALRDLIRSGDRALEIGCHHGFHTIFLCKSVAPDGKVVAVEAEPGNALIAQAQLTLNRLDRCVIEPAAAGEKPGRTLISLVDNVIDGAGMAEEKIEIPIITADELDRRHGPFSLLKIDVEGFEAKVLRGAAAIMARRPRLALELHFKLLRQAGDCLDDIVSILSRVGYGGFIMLSDGSKHAYEPNLLESLSGSHVKANLFLAPL